MNSGRRVDACTQQRNNQMTNGLGTPVHTRDGREIGAIDRLIVDPSGQQVKTAVIRKGLLLHRDVEVPLALLRCSRRGNLDLNLSAGEVDKLPLFREPLDPRQQTGYIAGAPYQGHDSGWLTTKSLVAPSRTPAHRAADHYAGRPPPLNATRGAFLNTDQTGTTVRRGSIVTGRDGKSVGTVRDAQFDPESGRLIALIIRTGSLIPKDWELTARLIAGLRNGVVYLKVDACQLMT
jgi:sporulation protein YlmC with PRC-barrel domain